MLDGYVHPDYGLVADVFARQLTRPSSGAAVCAYHGGDVVVDIWGGVRDAAGNAWQRDTMAMAFSTTKGAVSTALHVLVDRGLLDYDDRVADHWPEFAQSGKHDMRVRHILAHEAGLHDLRRLVDGADRMLDWAFMVRALAAAAPAYPPGTANGYHAFTYGWLAGELIQRVSGKALPDVLRADLAVPLGLDGFYLGVPKDQQYRVATLTRPVALDADRIPLSARIMSRLLGGDPGLIADAMLPPGTARLLWSPGIIEACIPAATGVFTARSLAKMYAALAGGGELGGVRIMSTATRDRAIEEQNRRRDIVMGFPMRWRLGYHIALTDRGSPPRSFGHFGFGGSGAWADPDTGLAVAMVCKRLALGPLGDRRLMALGGAALACTDRREGRRPRRRIDWPRVRAVRSGK